MASFKSSSIHYDVHVINDGPMRSPLAPTSQNGDGHNAKLKASEGLSTNQWVKSKLLRPTFGISSVHTNKALFFLRNVKLCL